MSFNFDDVATIIFVPDDKYEEEILRKGPCGSSPPTMWFDQESGIATEVEPQGDNQDNSRECLVLTYKGENLRRGFEECRALKPKAVIRTSLEDMTGAYVWAMTYQRQGLGRAFFLDENNKQVEEF